MNRLFVMSFFLFTTFSFLYPVSSEQLKHKNEFLDEQKCQHESAFSQFDIEFDEEEMLDYQRSKPPAKIIVYARQIGIGLLMRYLSIKNYIANIMTKIKNKIIVR